MNFGECPYECDIDGFTHYDGLPSNHESDIYTFMADYPWYEFQSHLRNNYYQPDLTWILKN